MNRTLVLSLLFLQVCLVLSAFGNFTGTPQVQIRRQHAGEIRAINAATKGMLPLHGQEPESSAL